MSTRFLRIREVASALDVSAELVRDWIRTGRIRGAVRPSGERGNWRIPASEVARLAGQEAAA